MVCDPQQPAARAALSTGQNTGRPRETGRSRVALAILREGSGESALRGGSSPAMPRQVALELKLNRWAGTPLRPACGCFWGGRASALVPPPGPGTWALPAPWQRPFCAPPFSAGDNISVAGLFGDR